MPMIIVAALIVVILLIYYYGTREHYRMYFGQGIKPLDDVCPSPFCGGDAPSFDEDTMYPFLVSTKDQEYTTDQEQVDRVIQDGKAEADLVSHLIGYDVTANDTVYSSNDSDADIKNAMNILAHESRKVDTSRGMERAPVEHFGQAITPVTYSALGAVVNDHPDMDNFNRMYYSNPGRTVGIADQQQAIIHFDESAAYYGNVQQTLPVSADASRWNDQGNPQMMTNDYFDIQDKYAMIMDDPRQAVASVDYSPGNGPVYKKRTFAVDLIDEMNRKRNQTRIEAAERGTRVTNNARDIMNTVFGSELNSDEHLPWWQAHEV